MGPSDRSLIDGKDHAATAAKAAISAGPRGDLSLTERTIYVLFAITGQITAAIRGTQQLLSLFESPKVMVEELRVRVRLREVRLRLRMRLSVVELVGVTDSKAIQEVVARLTYFLDVNMLLNSVAEVLTGGAKDEAYKQMGLQVEQMTKHINKWGSEI